MAAFTYFYNSRVVPTEIYGLPSLNYLLSAPKRKSLLESTYSSKASHKVQHIFEGRGTRLEEEAFWKSKHIYICYLEFFMKDSSLLPHLFFPIISISHYELMDIYFTLQVKIQHCCYSFCCSNCVRFHHYMLRLASASTLVCLLNYCC